MTRCEHEWKPMGNGISHCDLCCSNAFSTQIEKPKICVVEVYELYAAMRDLIQGFNEFQAFLEIDLCNNLVKDLTTVVEKLDKCDAYFLDRWIKETQT